MKKKKNSFLWATIEILCDEWPVLFSFIFFFVNWNRNEFFQIFFYLIYSFIRLKVFDSP